MKTAKRERLERQGWRFTSTEEFLELSDEEKVLVEIKLALADAANEKKEEYWPLQHALGRSGTKATKKG